MDFEQKLRLSIESKIKERIDSEALIDVLDRFTGDALVDSCVHEFKTKRTLCFMKITDFLDVVASGLDESKQQDCDRYVATGKLTSLPFYKFTHDGSGTATVVGHEGRHRARALLKSGDEYMPVVVISVGSQEGMEIRWDCQVGRGFDNLSRYDQVIPHRLISEDGDKEIAFPEVMIHEVPQVAPKGELDKRYKPKGL